MSNTKLKRAGTTISYTLLNFRYGSLVLPTGVVAFLLATPGIPGYLAFSAFVLLLAAFAVELVTSVINGVHTAQLIHQQQHDEQAIWDEISKYANGGWLDGSEEQAPDEGEASGEGEAGHPAR